jgi:transposase-like protein
MKKQAAFESIAAEIGCIPETLRRRVCQQERDTGRRPASTIAEDERIKALEREVRALRGANESCAWRVRFRPGGVRPPSIQGAAAGSAVGQRFHI